jgi:hypothetical protein
VYFKRIRVTVFVLRFGALTPPPSTSYPTTVPRSFRIVQLPAGDRRLVTKGIRKAVEYFIYAPTPNHRTQIGERLTCGAITCFSGLDDDKLFEPAAGLQSMMKRISRLHRQKVDYMKAWRETWVDFKLEILLAIGRDITAAPHDTPADPAYNAIFNLLDVPLPIHLSLTILGTR